MSFNLIDSVKALLSGDMLSKVSGMLGENSSNVQTAMSGIIPSILTGVLSKVGSGDSHGILNMAVDAAKTGIPGNLTSLVGSGGIASKGMDMLKNLFGDKASGLTTAIASFSGVSSQSASTLMSVAAPAALGVLGKHAIDNNINAGGLASFMNTQKDHILNAVPSGLNLAGVLGMGSLAGIGSKLSGALSGVTGAVGHQAERLSHAGAEVRDKAKGGSKWVWPLLLALIAIGLIWYFMNRNKPAETAVVPAMDSVAVKDSVATPPPYTVKLPDGTVLNANKGGIEDQLIVFLNDPTSKPGKDVWFNFDQLNFNTGSAEITPSSSGQVKNIALILKAYPKVKIKIGGYTDRTGDSVVNKKLSNSRAMSVATAIKADGASGAQIVGAEGYGSAFAKYPMDATDSLKAMDRHISVSVRSK